VQTEAEVQQDPAQGAPATLGDVLYAGRRTAVESEKDWEQLVLRVASGDQLALHAIYERAHRPVFTLIVRITANRETAEELTLDVFHSVWRRASLYDPANGTVLGWIMNQARSRAIDRLRFDGRKKRVTVAADDVVTPVAPDLQDVLQFKQESEELRKALVALTKEEREAIEAAFFAGLTYAEVAARLGTPLGTVKTRIRSGLHKLRKAMAEGPPKL
jgi:RNA polymerase sigma-70 factor (ECF subfamily)